MGKNQLLRNTGQFDVQNNRSLSSLGTHLDQPEREDDQVGELHAICTERYSNPYLRMLSTVQDGKNKENAGGQVREDQK